MKTVEERIVQVGLHVESIMLSFRGNEVTKEKPMREHFPRQRIPFNAMLTISGCLRVLEGAQVVISLLWSSSLSDFITTKNLSWCGYSGA